MNENYDPQEIAWCTGLYEGEGNIHLSTQKALTITKVNTSVNLLTPFEIFGGTVRPRAGKTRQEWRQVYQWRIGGNNQVKSFVETILPYIKSVNKRLQLDLALEYITFDWAQKELPNHMRDHNRYGTYYQRFKGLHH